jgi:hypothetical protein
MEIDTIINKMQIKYYKSLKNTLNKDDNNIEWIDNQINILKKNVDDKLTETQTEKKNDSPKQMDKHTQIFDDSDLYKKPWGKLTSIHKILKIKEFVNGLKINSEKERSDLRDELTLLIKDKTLAKKDKVNYDEEKGKIISLTNLQYKNGKYFYLE